MTRVLVCGGGSGGHVYPALALLEAFKRHPAVERVGLVGTRHGLEAKLLSGRTDLEFFPIHVHHFRGSLGHNLGALGSLGLGLVESVRLVRRFKPSLIVGTGGYASFPPLAAGLARGIPGVILEPNAVLGCVNRWLAPWVDRLFYHWPQAVEGLDLPRAVRTGVPLRSGLGRLKRTPELYRRWGLDPARKTLLVLGGSGGAPVLHEAARAALPHLEGWQVLLSLGARWSAGPPDGPRAQRLRAVPYIERMDEALALADAALTRGGAVTLAELCACGVPALVVPWEGAAGNHQLHNARCAARAGAGLLVREAELSEMTALETLQRWLAPGQLASRHCLSFALGHLHRKASARIVKEVEPYLEGNVSLRRHRWRRHERLGQGLLATAPSAARVQHRGEPAHL